MLTRKVVSTSYKTFLDNQKIKSLNSDIAENGYVLINDVPSIEAVHDLIKNYAIFPIGGETWAHHPKLPNTVDVTNMINEKTGRPGWFSKEELGWHCNGVFLKKPETYVSLYCDTPAESGGETELIHLRDVYNDLNETEKSSLAETIIQYQRTSLTQDRGFYELVGFELEEFKKHSIRKHPKEKEEPFTQQLEKKLIYKHPADGQLGLYFPFTLRDKIVGLSLLDSESILAPIIQKCLSEKYRTIIKWKKNDLLFMDQIHCLHQRAKYTGQRKLQRIAFWWASDE